MRFLAFILFATAAVAVAQPAQSPRSLPHPDTVYAVAFSPDGKTVATGCFDKSIRLWDTGTGKLLKTISGKNGHQNLVISVAFSNDGSQLVTTSTDNTAKVWDIPTEKPFAVRQQMGGQTVVRVAVSPDGKSIVTAAGLLPIRRWDAADPKAVADLGGHRGPSLGLYYSGNGAAVYSLGAGGELKYWNAADGKELGSIGVGGSSVALWVNPASGVPTTVSADGIARQWPANFPTPPKPLANAPAKARQAIVSADGAQLLVASEDQSVRVWNTAGGGESKLVIGKLPPGYFHMALSAKGDIVAVEGKRKVLFVGTDGKPRGELPASGMLTAFAFHPTEPKFQTIGLNGTVQTWPLPKSGDKEPVEPKPLTTRPTATAVSAVLLPQQNQVVVIDREGAVAVWDTTNGKEAKKVRDLGKVGPQPNALAVSADGSMVAASGNNSLKVWTLADGKELVPFAEQPAIVETLAFSKDKTRLAVSTGNSTVTVFSLTTGHAEQFVTHKGQVRGVTFHPSQPILYTAGDDTTVRATPLLITKLVADPLRFGKALSGFANGSSILTAGSGEGVLKVNAGNLNTEATYGKSKSVSAVTANKQNSLVAVAEANGTVTVFNANNPAESGSFKAPAKLLDLAFHPKDAQLAGVLADGRAMTWAVKFDPSDAKPEEKQFGLVLQVVPHDRATVLTYTPDGNTLLTGGGDAAVRSWKVIGDTARLSLQHPNIVNSAAFDSEGKQLATAGQDGIVRVYDLSKPPGTAPKSISAHVPKAPAQPQPVYAVLFTPDGKRVISASFDQSIKIHTVADGKLVKEIKPAAGKEPGHSDAVYALALSSDGKTLASGSADHTVKLWNPETGALIREFKNTVDPKLKDVSHPGYVQGLRFTSDGTKLVTVGTAPKNKGYLAVWNVADGKQFSGQELDVGPIHAVDVRADGWLVLGCASKIRGQSEAEAVVLPMPK